MLSNGTTVIHTPSGCYASAVLEKALEDFGWVNERPLEIGDEYLLVCNPLIRVQLIYQRQRRLGETALGIKAWFASLPPAPCSDLCPDPLDTIRIEHYRTDCNEYFNILPNDFPLPPPEEMEVCLHTRAAIRKHYKLDYVLGDYE